ncbi:MAG: general secretion pathway protein GspD [Comamonadaceae bacterium CG_4_9_14_0_8_um_filter_60_18]|nr:MAG: general secretion pathway protein GspD [Comamonadaceae bacterium CG_4_9_14_0_8_um_filter_60_18]
MTTEEHEVTAMTESRLPSPVSAARVASLLAVSLLLGACSTDRPLRTPSVSEAIRTEVPMPAAPAAVVPARVADALAEPTPPAVPVPPEPRIDLLVNNAPVRQVFLAMVADTRYSMLMHPDVAGTLSVTLRGVTVTEALEAIRDVYGYDFKIEGRRITVYAPTLQTRMFTVNYPNSQRSGNSDLRVASGGSSQGTTSGSSSASTTTNNSTPSTEGSRISTASKTDYWTELTAAVKSLVGSADGRSVVISPQAGIMAVRAMPEELRQVEKFLKAAQLSVERQVMLEAKIVEVELRDGYQSGVNWAAFGTVDGNPLIAGVLGSGLTATNPLLQGGSTVLPGVVPVPSTAIGGGVFGLALATSQFAAVMGFLETQGDVQTLSSPRIATLNNQKAVLKVGSEESFINGFDSTNTSTNSTSSINGSNITLPTPRFERFFSGISLDVTPQIDDGVNITLHVHPAVTNVTTKNLVYSNGANSNSSIPTASSNVNESDTLVRIQDGSIVAIGGLMQIESNLSSSGLPGSGETIFSSLLGNKANTGRRKEVVVLIKPTIIRSQQDWDAQNRRSRAALDDMEAARARVIRIDGTVETRPSVQ